MYAAETIFVIHTGSAIDDHNKTIGWSLVYYSHSTTTYPPLLPVALQEASVVVVVVGFLIMTHLPFNFTTTPPPSIGWESPELASIVPGAPIEFLIN